MQINNPLPIESKKKYCRISLKKLSEFDCETWSPNILKKNMVMVYGNIGRTYKMTKEKSLINLLEASNMIIYITRIVKCKEILSEMTDGKISRM